MEALVKRYQELFGLQNWIIEIKTDSSLNAAAKTIADPRYYRAEMTFGSIIKKEELEEIIVHEMIHIVMALYDFYADNLGKEGSDELFFVARENSVSQLTHVMMRFIKRDHRLLQETYVHSKEVPDIVE